MRRFLLLYTLLISGFCSAQSGGVGIGTTAPDANAALEIRSTNKALIIPRLSTQAIGALTPKEGMLVYNYDSQNFMGYAGGTPNSITAFLSPTHIINPPAGIQVAQTYLAPSTFLLKDFGVYIASGPINLTYILSVYQGTGNTGTLLGTSTVNLPPGTGGVYYFNLINSNITLVSGNTYTFALTPSVTNAENYIAFYLSNPYSEGVMLYNNAVQNSNYDLSMDVRAAGPGNWRKFAADTSTSNGIALSSGSGTTSMFNFYEEASFTVNFSNGATVYASNYTVKVVRVGKQVIVTFPSDLLSLNVSGAPVVSIGTFPVRFLPQSPIVVPIPIQSNGTASMGIARVTSGGIGLYAGNMGAPFSGANSGIRACSITYAVQ